MTPDQELAAFEAWAMYKADLQKGSAGEYVDIFARVMLDAWQARAAIEAERQAMRDPVEADTEDLIKRLLDAQQDINLAANEHMSQPLCDASALIDEIEQVLRRLSPQPQQIPSGWQLVPKKPTADMKKASLKACDGKVYPADMRIGPMARNADVYRAMLAAAPDPEDTP